MDTIDLTVFQNDRFVDLSSNNDVEYRGYVSENYKSSTTFNIGRTNDTGTGDVENEVTNPDPRTLPFDSGFPDGSTVGYESEDAFKRIDIHLGGDNQAKGRVGAFYVEAADTLLNAIQITTILTADDGKYNISYQLYD